MNFYILRADFVFCLFRDENGEEGFCILRAATGSKDRSPVLKIKAKIWMLIKHPHLSTVITIMLDMKMIFIKSINSNINTFEGMVFFLQNLADLLS